MNHTPFIKLPNETDSTSGIGQFVLDRRESALDESDDSTRSLMIDNAALNETLRRQSLFQLKDSLIGKVSRQVNEIEKRKRSPRSKEKAESSGGEGNSVSTSSNTSVTKRYVSPVRIPSIFSKKTANLEAPPQDQYVINTKSKYISENKLSKTIATCLAEKRKKTALGNRTNESSSSPLIVKAAAQFCRRHMNRNRSVKRLNSSNLSSYHARSNLSAISENHTPVRQTAHDNSDAKSPAQPSASPSLLLSNKLKCTSESIDL